MRLRRSLPRQAQSFAHSAVVPQGLILPSPSNPLLTKQLYDSVAGANLACRLLFLTPDPRSGDPKDSMRGPARLLLAGGGGQRPPRQIHGAQPPLLPALRSEGAAVRNEGAALLCLLRAARTNE